MRLCTLKNKIFKLKWTIPLFQNYILRMFEKGIFSETVCQNDPQFCQVYFLWSISVLVKLSTVLINRVRENGSTKYRLETPVLYTMLMTYILMNSVQIRSPLK